MRLTVPENPPTEDRLTVDVEELPTRTFNGLGRAEIVKSEAGVVTVTVIEEVRILGPLVPVTVTM